VHTTMVKDERGFTLLELLLAAVLTVGLTAAVFGLMRQSGSIFVSEYGVKDMNDNARVVMDLLTRDIQSAGAGLPRGAGNFASIYNATSAGTAPDSILLISGDLYAPYAAVAVADAGGTYYDVFKPVGINGTSAPFTYIGSGNQTLNIYQTYSTAAPTQYIVYDDTHASIFQLTAGGTLNANKFRLTHNAASDISPGGAFATAVSGATIDTGAPNYGVANVAMLGGLISYRLNTVTKELERTQDLTNWYAVARGIISFKIKYRLETKTPTKGVVETISTKPGVDTTSQTTDVTSRRDIRSVIVTIEAETPDAAPGNEHYRTETFKFEITPRNLNLLNNNNLSNNVKTYTGN
jgi:Tfp pilus assembly protein PilW